MTTFHGIAFVLAIYLLVCAVLFMFGFTIAFTRVSHRIRKNLFIAFLATAVPGVVLLLLSGALHAH